MKLMKVLNIFFVKNIEGNKNLFVRNILRVSLFCGVKVSWCYYRPPTKLGESIVIKGVSQSICPGGKGIPGPTSFPGGGVGISGTMSLRVGMLVTGPFQGWVGMSVCLGGWVYPGGGYPLLILSESVRYVSYWNAFLFNTFFQSKENAIKQFEMNIVVIHL